MNTNLRTYVMAGIAGGAIIAFWTLFALFTISGVPRWFCISSAVAGGILVAYFVGQRVALGTGPPRDVTFVAVLLTVALPLSALLYGISWDVAAAGPSTMPAEDKDRKELRIVDTELLERKTGEYQKKAFDRGVEYARGTGTEAPPEQQQVARREPFLVDPDGSGGAVITLNVPEANFVPTRLTFRHGEAFYISTPHYVANLQAGIIKKIGGRKTVVWTPVSANEFWSLDQPHRMRLESAPEAGLCFGATAVPGGTYRIVVRKSPGPLGPADYLPGVPLGRVLY